MKKFVSLFLTVLVIGSLFISGCKKGEEDPSISLLSRKARLTNTWQLTVGNWTVENYDSKVAAVLPGFDKIFKNEESKATIRTTVFNYEENKLTVDYGNNYIDVYQPFEYKINFYKDNTFEINVYSKETDDEDYYEYWYTAKGYWYFLDGNDQLETKDKQRVMLEVNYEYNKEHYHEVWGDDYVYDDTDESEWSYEGTTSNNTYGSVDKPMYILNLKKLANDELKLLFDEKEIYDNGDYRATTGEMTFTPYEAEE